MPYIINFYREKGSALPSLVDVEVDAMQGCRTDTEYTRSLGFNSVCYITSRIGWVSLKGIFSYCRRNPEKLYKTFRYTYFNERSTPA